MTTTFHLYGLTSAGQFQRRDFIAGSRTEAVQAARQAGLSVIDVPEPGLGFGVSSSSSSSSPFSSSLSPKPKRSFHGTFDLALFAQELITLLGAGLSLIETLETLAERQQQQQSTAPSPDRGNLLMAELVRRMQEGRSFSAALRDFPATFPDLFIASIAASEHTGETVPALQRWLRYHEQLGVIRQKIVSASIYPALLCAVGAAVALFLLCFLVPRFSRVYEGMEDKLPIASRWLMHWGMFASEHWMAVVVAFVVFAVAALLSLTSPAAKSLFGAALQRNRWIGPRLRLMQLSRFYRSLGLLLGGGIPLMKALRMAQGLLPAQLQMAAASAMQEVSQGQRLSDSLQAALLTTPVALRLLRAGERNGQMADMLEQSAAFHDKEMAHWIDRFTRLFEPVLMLVIGLAIGGIVILLYLPIFELAGSLQ